MKRKLILWLPFAVCAALFGVFFLGLIHPDDHVIASQMVGKPMPAFDAPAAIPGQPGMASTAYGDGKPRILNVFASWCVPCVQEIPVLMKLKAAGAEVDGLAIHDTTDALNRFLEQNGNPYTRIGLDNNGQAQIAFGSAGVPESFVVDGKGKILYQHIGVITEADMPKLLTMLEQAK